MKDQEFNDAKEADRLENHPEKDTIKKIQKMMAKEKSVDENYQSLRGTETADRIEGLLNIPMKKRFLNIGVELVKDVLQNDPFEVEDVISHLLDELISHLNVIPLDEENEGDESLKEHFGRFLKDYQ